ncbi:ABC transporter substrate-binding protein [Microcoleus sp. herbarium19]|uniref:ABC transporter substrate-binding protein n=1 Tax=unclassified Microcoleus TaxID=2642155 RepID=UPI002FD3875A
MRQKNETILLLISLAVAGFLIAVVLWLLEKAGFPPHIDFSSYGSSGETALQYQRSLSFDLKERMSYGQKQLVEREDVNLERPEFRAAKNKGIEAMAAGKYQQAVGHFEQALRSCSNAPETRIYLNNARIGDRKCYTIAVAAPTANQPNAALDILRGVAQAQSQINQAGGINGRPLKVIIANDDDHPAVAKQIASALVKNREVLSVIGHHTSTATLAALPIYDLGKLPVISGTSTAVKPANLSRYFFRTVPTAYVGGRALADYLLTKLKKRNVAVFFNHKSAYSESLKSEFVAAVSLGGGQVVAEFDLSNPGFSPAKSIEKAISRGAEAIMLNPDYDALDKALQVVTVNNRRLFVLGDMGTMYSKTTLEVGGDSAVGMVMAVAWHIDGDRKSEFSRQSRQLWKADVGWVSAMTYDATMAAVSAIDRSPTRQGIQEVLSASDFVAKGATGPIRFLPSGVRNMPVQLVKVHRANPSRSGTGFDFVPMK